MSAPNFRLLALATIFAAFLLSPGFGKSAQEIARESFPAVVLIIVSDANGQAISLGSGFVVKPGLVVTNYHVIKGGTRAAVKLVGKSSRFEVVGVLAVDAVHDLALLKSDERLDRLLGFIEESTLPTVGDTVYAVGNPRGLEGTFSTGIVSGVRILDRTTLVQITAPISPGSSGGPVLDVNGKVIGLAVSAYRGGQNLNFAIPISAVKALLAKPQKLSPLAAVNAHESKPDWMSIGEDEKQAVYASHVEYGSQGIHFTVQNRMPFTVGSVSGIIIFYDSEGGVVDTTEFELPQNIRPGLAYRTYETLNPTAMRLSIKARTEIRILSMRRITD